MGTRLRVRRVDWDEQRAIRDLPPNLRVPRIASDEFALVEPHLDPGGTERVGDALRRFRVLRRVRQEDGPVRRAHRHPPMPWADLWPLTSDLRAGAAAASWEAYERNTALFSAVVIGLP